MMRPEYSREYTRIADDLGVKPEVVDVFVNDTNEPPGNLINCYVGEYESDVDFAQEMAIGCGDLKPDAEWPYTCIDWDRAARELMYDYTRLDVLVSGGTYEYHYVSNY